MPVSNIKPQLRAQLQAIGIKIADTPGLIENIAEIQQKVTLRGQVYALLEVDASQVEALAGRESQDPTMEAEGCPGDDNYIPPAAGAEVRRTLACLVRDNLIEAFHCEAALPGEKGLITVMLSPEQGSDWLNHLDRTTTALVEERPSRRLAAHKRDGGRRHVFAGVDPMDDGDDRDVP
jgi:hypothetical protein